MVPQKTILELDCFQHGILFACSDRLRHFEGLCEEGVAGVRIGLNDLLERFTNFRLTARYAETLTEKVPKAKRRDARVPAFFVNSTVRKVRAE
jgi:hypothetical protein